MKHELPDFDTLMRLAQNSPEEFEALRDILNRELIESAPAHMQARLRGLLFQIDGRRRTASNPTQSCVSVFAMMQDSLMELHNALNSAAGNPGPELARGPRALQSAGGEGGKDEKPISAEIIPFPVS